MGSDMSVSIKVDGGELQSLVDRTNALPTQIADALVASVNKVARATFDTSKRKIAEQVNLTSSYIDSKMRLDLATSAPTATITAAGRGVLLARFGATQVVKVNRTGRGKGNPSLGIAAGYRAAGVSVRVKVGGAGSIIEHGFFMRLNNGNGMGVFTRDRYGKVRVRYGPSVDQVFKGVSESMSDDVGRLLETEIMSELDKL